MGRVEAFRTLFGVIVIGLLVVGVLMISEEEKLRTVRNSKWLKVVGKDRHDHVHPAGLDPNSMSKRKVPNGPDPIHNRKAGNSGRPPGVA